MISVIVPIYNCEKYLQRCLESIRLQTYEDIEIILIDDGSSDGSAEICHAYEACDCRFKYFYKPNGGASSARNYGIDRANGEYIGFVDADDEILPDMFEVLYRTLSDNGADISIVAFIMNVDGRSLRYTDTNSVQRFGNREAVCELHKGTLFGGHLPNKLFKSSLFENVHLREDIAIGEDLVAVWELMRKSSLIVYVDAHKYVYRMNSGSAFYGSFKESFLSYIRATEILISEMQMYFPECVDYAIMNVLNAYIDVISKLYYSGLLDKQRYREYKRSVKEISTPTARTLLPMYKRVILGAFCTSRICYVICIRGFNFLKKIIIQFNKK